MYWLNCLGVLVEKLRRLSEERGVSVEELVIDKLLEEVDPENRGEVHWEMAREYLREAREELDRGDYRQANEKIWGAAVLAVKALAYERGRKRLTSHGELWRYVDELIRETGDEELGDLWRTATAMHINFYENWAPKGEVERSLRRVEALLGKTLRIKAIKGNMTVLVLS